MGGANGQRQAPQRRDKRAWILLGGMGLHFAGLAWEKFRTSGNAVPYASGVCDRKLDVPFLRNKQRNSSAQCLQGPDLRTTSSSRKANISSNNMENT